jgi:hypothetical protein
MSDDDIARIASERKPGIYTPEWHAATRAMTLEERGFTSCVVAAMQHFDLPPPSAEEAATIFNIPIENAKRLLTVLAAIPPSVVAAQMERFSELPTAIVREMLA